MIQAADGTLYNLDHFSGVHVAPAAGKDGGREYAVELGAGLSGNVLASGYETEDEAKAIIGYLLKAIGEAQRTSSGVVYLSEYDNREHPAPVARLTTAGTLQAG